MNIQEKIRQELQNPDFPDLAFLYSPEVLAIAPEFLLELLEEEKRDFEEKISKKYKGLDENVGISLVDTLESGSTGQVQDLPLQKESRGKSCTYPIPLTFDTFEDFSELDYFFGLLEHYQGVHNDETIRQIIEDFEPLYVDFGNEIAYNKRLYEMYRYLYDNVLTQHLTLTLSSEEREQATAQQRIIEKTLKAYEVRGIALPEEKQQRLKEISKELSELTQTFSNNILDDRKDFEYIISDTSLISEMPEDDQQVAKKKYEEKYGIKKAQTEEEYKKCFEFFKKMWKDEFEIIVGEDQFQRFQQQFIFYIGGDNIIACSQSLPINDFIFQREKELVGIAKSGEKLLGRIGVLKEHRGKYFGSKLIQFTKNYFAQSGEKIIFLPSEINNISYYNKFGFESFSQPKPCGNTQEVWMKCDLQDAISSPLDKGRIERGGFLFDASAASYTAIMKYSSDENIRKHFYDARIQSASSGKYDNRENILKILKLREEKANILGYNNYAELSLVFKMAESSEQIKTLFGEISLKARPKAEAELEEIKNYFKLENLNAWDSSFYSRKLREEKYELDEKELKKYFVFENVRDALFETVKRLYNLELKKIQVTLYTVDAELYEVYKDGNFVSYFYTDYFYTPLKSQGAWANIQREVFENKKKIVVNVCNFQKNTEGKTLLTLDEVETMYHEFGHAIHEMLSFSSYSELSGFHVEWDFIELPSQILENWCRHPDGMKLFARHCDTGKTIPDTMLAKLQKLDTFGNGNFVLKQNEFAMLDMRLHSERVPHTFEELQEISDELYLQNSLFPLPKNYKCYASFSHIFDGGYAAGYYSYMWAEIIEKEVWKAFKDSGNIFSQKIATRFHDTILSAGSSKKASELFRDFFGREVEIDAFLQEKGLM